MNTINFYYGLVESVEPDYSITFRIPEILDNLSKYPVAHPLVGHTTEIVPGNNILIMQPSLLQDYFYFQVDQETFTGLKFGNCIIDISDGKVITNKIVTLNNDGSINKTLTESTMTDKGYTIKSNDSNGITKATIDMSNNTLEFKAGNTRTVLDAIDGISTEASKTKIGKGTIGSLKMDGVVTPTGSGPLCALPFCVLTGAPHVGTLVVGNTGIELF